MLSVSSSETSDNIQGVSLALVSCIFIGSSFIIKKKGLKKAASLGLSAGSGGHSYLLEPLWWSGMITMIIGEVANFVAYAYAPAVLVAPLGAFSIIVSAILAHLVLKESLHALGILGCLISMVGSIMIVLHAPSDGDVSSVEEIWGLATQSAFLMYTISAFSLALVLVIFVAPHYGQTHVIVSITICSLMGSLTVMCVRALGIAIRLTFGGENQFLNPHAWIFVAMFVLCGVTQLNYLNKALDVFDTATVSLIYYVMFTSSTIVASVIMYKTWEKLEITSIISEICGFLIILSGMTLLLATKNIEDTSTFGIGLYSICSQSLTAPFIGGVAGIRHIEYSIK